MYALAVTENVFSAYFQCCWILSTLLFTLQAICICVAIISNLTNLLAQPPLNNTQLQIFSTCISELYLEEFSLQITLCIFMVLGWFRELCDGKMVLFNFAMFLVQFYHLYVYNRRSAREIFVPEVMRSRDFLIELKQLWMSYTLYYCGFFWVCVSLYGGKIYETIVNTLMEHNSMF